MGYKKSVFQSLAMVTQLGLCVVTPVLFCVFAGNYIDSRYGTKTLVFLLILGTLGGGRGAYVMAKRLIDRQAKEEEEERLRLLESALKCEDRSVTKPKMPGRIRFVREETDAREGREELHERSQETQ